MFSLQQFNPFLVGREATPDVEATIRFFDSLHVGQQEKPRDLSRFFTVAEAKAFDAVYEETNDDRTRELLIRRTVHTLIVQQVIYEERISEGDAIALTDWALEKFGVPPDLGLANLEVKADPNAEPEKESGGGTETVTSTAKFRPPCARVLAVAADIHFRLLFKMYCASVELHIADFKSLFPAKGCVHDIRLVMKKLRDPSYQATEEEREEHFRDNREAAFNTMMSFGGWKVAEEALNPKAGMMQTATIYRVLQGKFDPESMKVNEGLEPDGKVKSLPKIR